MCHLGMTLRPRKYEESSQPTMVRLPDKALWIQQTLSVKNSKMMYRRSAKEPEVSPPKDALENCGQNSVGESINPSSGFTGISSATASHCFATSAVDVEDHFDHTKEEIGEEPHESEGSVSFLFNACLSSEP